MMSSDDHLILIPGGDLGCRPAEMHPASPRRRVDWRWLRAHALVEAGVRPRKRDDAQVRRARNYVAALHRRGHRDARRLDARMADIAEARDLSCGEPHRRWEVQARLLADEPIEAIACKTLVDPATIGSYARLFFDVAGRLGNRGYIIHSAIKLHAMPKEPGDGVIWRLFGYFGGPVVVDALVGAGAFDGTTPPADSLRNFAAAHIRSQLQLKLCVALMTLPIGGQAARGLLRVFLRFMATEQRSARVPSADPLMPAVRAWPEDFPAFPDWSISCVPPP
jgi:hypothetical protein